MYILPAIVTTVLMNYACVIYWITYSLTDVANMLKLIHACSYTMTMKFSSCIAMFMCYDLLYKWYIFMFIV